MTKKTNKNLAIIIFPYLFIHEKEGLQIDGFLIKPSYSENIDKEPPEVKSQLSILPLAFRYGRQEQIFQWSYIVTNLKNKNDWLQLKKKLDKFTCALRYSQLRDLRENVKFEHFNYFVFEIVQRNYDAKDYNFYEGILNGESSIGFQFDGKKFIRPFCPNDEIRPQALMKSQIEGNEFVQALYWHNNFLFKGDEENRILRSIEWFNKSYAYKGLGIDTSEAILNVHIAFEALLRPEDDDKGIKAQIRTAFNCLLGTSKEVDTWFNQYWKLRNAIVHGDIDLPPIMYIHPESKSRRGHRHNLYLARKIFVKCLDALLKLRKEFTSLGLDEELYSNDARATKAINALQKKNLTTKILYESGTLDNISGLRNDDISAGKTKTKKLGELFLPFVREDVDKLNKTELNKLILSEIYEIISFTGNDYGKLALIYSKLESSYQHIYFSDSKKNESIEIIVLKGAAYNFFSYATWMLLTFYS